MSDCDGICGCSWLIPLQALTTEQTCTGTNAGNGNMGEQRKGGREEECVHCATQSSLEFKPKLYELSGQNGDMIDLEYVCTVHGRCAC